LADIIENAERIERYLAGLDVIWNAARNDLPGLAADARRALAQLQADQNNASGAM
jgi:uncharacterized protein with HEPN domain